jgi:hypothetical protein
VPLTRTHGRAPAWAAYATYFWERYGAGVLVPVRDAVDLAAGIGFPADYPMSLWPQTPPPAVLPRDEKLAAKAMHAAITGSQEIVLTEADIADLADTPTEAVAPHVEIGLRIRSSSRSAVDRGDFLIDVRPAWTGAPYLDGSPASWGVDCQTSTRHCRPWPREPCRHSSPSHPTSPTERTSPASLLCCPTCSASANSASRPTTSSAWMTWPCSQPAGTCTWSACPGDA